MVSALATLPVARGLGDRTVALLFILDGYSLLYMGLVLAATLAVVAMAYPYLQARPSGEERREECYLLLTTAALGACVLVSAAHFASLFLGLELLGVSLYALLGYTRARPRALEAAVKYLVLSAAASAFLLFGLALLYAETGTMELARIGTIIRIQERMPILLLAGGGFLLAGMGFKLGIAPFHLWVPDVYQGAPAPITAFIATASKAAVLALLLRLASSTDLLEQQGFRTLVAVAAGLSMLLGNLLALQQRDVKRILAYSSIAHLGYALIAFLAAGRHAAEAVTLYLAAYTVMSLGAFTVVTMLSDRERDGDEITLYAGLFWRRPWLAAAMAVLLLSLAGIPMTIGFIGKFYVITAGVAAERWGLLLLLVAGSVIGLFYYLRVVAAMAGEVPQASRLPWTIEPSPSYWIAGCVLALMTGATILTGLYPEPVISLLRALL
jgi:NADH-quinone oxidoreductase subunit N